MLSTRTLTMEGMTFVRSMHVYLVIVSSTREGKSTITCAIVEMYIM